MPQAELLTKIQAFQFQPQFKLFLHELKKSTQWPSRYCLSCIEEYKKFLFLKTVSNAPISPCFAVEQVWHTHMTFTQSYWIDLCEHLLQKELHFEPVEEHELSLIEQHYKNTWYLYIKYFQSTPPSHIWPKAVQKPLQLGSIQTRSTYAEYQEDDEIH